MNLAFSAKNRTFPKHNGSEENIISQKIQKNFHFKRKSMNNINCSENFENNKKKTSNLIIKKKKNLLKPLSLEKLNTTKSQFYSSTARFDISNEINNIPISIVAQSKEQYLNYLNKKILYNEIRKKSASSLTKEFQTEREITKDLANSFKKNIENINNLEGKEYRFISNVREKDNNENTNFTVSDNKLIEISDVQNNNFEFEENELKFFFYKSKRQTISNNNS